MSQPKHHALFDRRSWGTHKESRGLRSMEWLQPPLEADAHRELHKVVPLIPVPSFHTLTGVIAEYEPLPGDYEGSVVSLMGAIYRVTSRPSTRPIERQLAAVTINALELQLPFIREGLAL